ncbi:MAG: DUF3667 domain-containing protein [Candidatus Didemnitutus sp.]|nr:DUF3667 domain-containing protein [Candidatus Didemnitutus sp.]
MPLDPTLPDDAPLADAVTADQLAAHATAPHGHAHGPIHTHCENCGTELKGPFCHACGQHDFEFHRSFWHVFLEALENFFHFDAKFFRNIVTLLFRPGQLTADFNAGKRASQMPPFRLYVFTAFVFFLLLFATTGKEFDGINIVPDNGHPAAVLVNGQPATIEQALDAVATAQAAPAPEKRNVDKLRDLAQGVERDARARREKEARQPNRPHVSVAKSDKPAKDKSDFDRFIEHQGERSLDPEFRRELGHAFLAALPKLLLVCLPLFALYTRLLFRKSGQVYLQHLVVAIHFHTFIYLWVMFRDGWTFLGRFAHLGGLIAFAANLWLFLYPFFMLRRLYGNSWLLTIFKTGVLSAIYSLTLAAGFFATAILLFLLL